MSFQDQLQTPICVICEANISNVAFSCGHITTCEYCTFRINFCVECWSATGNRVRVTYHEQLKAVVLENIEPNQRQ